MLLVQDEVKETFCSIQSDNYYGARYPSVGELYERAHQEVVGAVGAGGVGAGGVGVGVGVLEIWLRVVMEGRKKYWPP